MPHAVVLPVAPIVVASVVYVQLAFAPVLSLNQEAWSVAAHLPRKVGTLVVAMAEPVFVLVAVVAKALPKPLGDWSHHHQLHVLQEIVLGLVWPPEPALALLTVVVPAVQVASQLIVLLRLQLLVQLVQGYG